MTPEFITDQNDPRLSDLWQPDDLSAHSDLLHISLCAALYELTRLRSEVATLTRERDDRQGLLNIVSDKLRESERLRKEAEAALCRARLPPTSSSA